MPIDGLHTRIIEAIPAVPEFTENKGQLTFNLTPGEPLEIKGGEDRSEEEVPGGKKWKVIVNLTILESDI